MNLSSSAKELIQGNDASNGPPALKSPVAIDLIVVFGNVVQHGPI